MYRANIGTNAYALSPVLFFNWKYSVQDTCMIEAHYNELFISKRIENKPNKIQNFSLLLNDNMKTQSMI